MSEFRTWDRWQKRTRDSVLSARFDNDDNDDIYQGESKVLQYFHNMQHNLIASDAFDEVMKVTNYT